MIQSAASPRSKPGTSGNAAIAGLLADLRSAHENLIAAMNGMERLTRGPLSERDSYTTARWRISRASLKRRSHWAKIYQHLIAGVGADDAAALNNLQAADMRMLRRSAAHVCTWSRDAIDRDWLGYCKASRVIRLQMKTCMDAEKHVLFPMLERLASDRD
ncbi:MAG TPA: hypothetical protein VMN38_10735 [Sphingomicrobium sp.]|nr:hypothetical protein [Sphingomicrobium sp.]